ncbi:MAG: MerR family transcriptional regulator [Proteobacteria bacterium]|nr:MerR family transcriptional regulator [Pseudomonadota bacterium]
MELERAHPRGVGVQEVVDILASRGMRLSEATFRKYVQLGLLPRSVRVGRKGKNRGSQGLYPATVVRQLDLIRRLMAQGLTIDEIRRELLFVRGDVDDLARRFERVFEKLGKAIEMRGEGDEVLARAISDAKALADRLVEGLKAIEVRLAARARMARAVV